MSPPSAMPSLLPTFLTVLLVCCLLPPAASSHADLLQDLYAEPQFAMVFDNTPVPLSRVKEADPLQIVVSSKDVEHLCFLPPPSTVEDLPEASKPPNPGNVLDLLSPLRGNCLHKSLGWWTYTVCFDEEITQFHEEQNKILSQYSLGSRLEPYAQDPNELVFEAGYVSQRFVAGTLCDLTEKPRETEVRYYCNPEALEQIESIRETSTCQYLIRVATPRLCSHPAFTSQQKGPVSNIVCHPLISMEKFKQLVGNLDTSLFTRAPQRPSAKEVLADVFKKGKAPRLGENQLGIAERIMKDMTNFLRKRVAEAPLRQEDGKQEEDESHTEDHGEEHEGEVAPEVNAEQ